MSDEAVNYDRELQRYQELLTSHWAVQPDDRVLDVGCGHGETTRAAARAAYAGRALGVDISPQMIAAARDITHADGPGNATFVCCDAASAQFDRGEFDLAISRFGTMFFADPLEGFSNIALALRSGGKLMMLVWRNADLNEWTIAIRHALYEEGSHPSPSSTLNAFSLGEQDVTTNLLTGAGFSQIAFCDASEPVHYGWDTTAALEWICGFANVKQALAEKSIPDRSRALKSLSEVVVQHNNGEGIWFGARAWLVSARKP